MKKIYYLLYLVVAVLVTACTHEEEDLFGDSSANRADAAVKANLEILTSATDGWLMEYFPEAHQMYGGFNVFLKFDTGGKVSVAGEIAAPEQVVTSLYSVKQSAGILLSFDTYNQIFHFFSDPSDPSGLGGDGYGMEGDYDFLIQEATAEKVVLKGKKSGGVAVLTPAKTGWSDYLETINTAETNMFSKKYLLHLNGADIAVSSSVHSLIFTYEENGNSLSQTASYIVTPTGYKFYAPVVISGVTLNGFTYNAGSDSFTEATQSSITLVKVISPVNEQFADGNWYIAYSQLGEFAQTYFAYCKQNYLDAMGEELIFAFMGSSLYGRFGFNFNSSGFKGLLGYDYVLMGEDKISLKFNMTGVDDGVWYHNNAGFSYLLNPFGYNAARTFTVTTDNLRNPSYMTLTEDANPDNSITLFAQEINYPFKN